MPRKCHASPGPAQLRLDTRDANAKSARLDPSLGWYGRAKVEAELHMAACAQMGGNVIVLRPGCVWGPGSKLWVSRVAQWLRAGRLGDLGEAGDGWSNLVHVDDVCNAVLAALWLPPRAGAPRAFNLAASDSPRWNRYFMDLGVAIGATPVERLSARRVKWDAMLAGPALKVAQMAVKKLGVDVRVPEPLTPGLVGLFARQLRQDCSAATRELGVPWTPRIRRQASRSGLGAPPCVDVVEPGEISRRAATGGVATPRCGCSTASGSEQARPIP